MNKIMRNKILFFCIGVIIFFLSAYLFDVGGKSIVSKIIYAIGTMLVFSYLTNLQNKDKCVNK